MAEPTPAPGGTSTSERPSLSMSRTACTGAPPPKATIEKPPRSLPCSTAWTRAAFAMFSSTTSVTPTAAVTVSRSRGAAMVSMAPVARWGDSEMSLAPKVSGCRRPRQDVGVGHGGVVPAEVVGGRAGFRAGAARPDADLPEGVHGGDGAAAGADLQHLDHRDGDGHAAALLEPGRPRHLEAGGGARHVVLDEGDLGRRAAHVERADAVAAVAGGQIGGEHGAARRPRLHQPHGERRRNLHAQQAAAGVDEVQRAGGAAGAEFGLQATQVRGHQRLHVGVGAGGVEALVLAHPRRDLAAQRDGDAGARPPAAVRGSGSRGRRCGSCA